MLANKKIGVIIPAAGRGKRMGGSQSKQFLELAGKPIIIHTLSHFESSDIVDVIVVGIDPNNINKLKRLIREYELKKVKQVVLGGEERQDTVFRGLLALKSEEVDIVIVHDAVRPFITQKDIVSVTEAASEHGGAIVAVQPKDTVKVCVKDFVVHKTLSRENIWIAQTPQAFKFQLLLESYENALRVGYYSTDDASLFERMEMTVRIIEGTYDNIKITTPEDLDLAELIACRISSRSN